MMNSGQRGGKLVCCSRVSALQRARDSQAASGARQEPSGSRKPVLGPKPMPVSSCSTQTKSVEATYTSCVPPIPPTGVMMVTSPCAFCSILNGLFRSENRINCSSVTGAPGLTTSGNASSVRSISPARTSTPPMSKIVTGSLLPCRRADVQISRAENCLTP